MPKKLREPRVPSELKTTASLASRHARIFVEGASDQSLRTLRVVR